ncbi:MAG: M15 family metallopeptidase [Candidatus Thiodubiliella endoseptemdiera]|uniref:M15 family metallopeptidase n=1 Tax=Candidatus Thiodubiliella endoseptemdiera TaxID=2738886 RepID=A0A853F1D5_9GAMM|nr:M15 family metallopeptidase [Candidatus Thiodubiliella endoseptemdiera]
MFNCRKITGESGFSLHSYGTALDLSYYRNPYIGIYKLDKNNDGIAATGVIVIPDSQLIFLARNQHTDGFNEAHVDYLRSQGLSEWGGHC